VKSFKKTCVFVCTQKGGCGACGSKKLAKELKKLVKRSEDEISGSYKIIESGCLGHCSSGIVAVAFPLNRIFTKLDKRSAPRLLAELEGQRRTRDGFRDVSEIRSFNLEPKLSPLSH
jgi:NADH:ubiquinone oxidoreductase subunit E